MRLFLVTILLAVCSMADAQTIYRAKDLEQDAKIERIERTLSDLQSIVTRLENKLDGAPTTPAPPPPVENDIPAVQRIVEKGAGRTTWTQSELDTWIRSRYSPTTRLSYDVAPRSGVYRHLTQGASDHAPFSASQVNGLERWVALALHDAAHKNLITPTRTTQTSSDVVQFSTSASSDGYRTEVNGNWLYWWVNGTRWSNLGNGFHEGKRWTGNGRSFVYRSGTVYDADSVQAKSVVSSPIYNTGCANGQCNRPRTYLW